MKGIGVLTAVVVLEVSALPFPIPMERMKKATALNYRIPLAACIPDGRT